MLRSRQSHEMETVMHLAQEYGNVKSCRVLFDHSGVSKQVAFVQFETNQQALDSIAALHNKEVLMHCTKCCPAK